MSVEPQGIYDTHVVLCSLARADNKLREGGDYRKYNLIGFHQQGIKGYWIPTLAMVIHREREQNGN